MEKAQETITPTTATAVKDEKAAYFDLQNVSDRVSSMVRKFHDAERYDRPTFLVGIQATDQFGTSYTSSVWAVFAYPLRSGQWDVCCEYVRSGFKDAEKAKKGDRKLRMNLNLVLPHISYLSQLKETLRDSLNSKGLPSYVR